MRALIAQEKGDQDPWNLKLVAGGLLDIEFMAQCLVLAHAHEDRRLLNVETEGALAAAGAAGFLSAELMENLLAAHKLYAAVMQMARLTTDGRFNPEQAAAGVLRRIASAAGLPDFRRLEAELEEARGRVHAAFETVVGGR
jgi:glutamate-ammonia-ligase adenylyltransferase